MRLPSMPASVGPLGPGLAASLPTSVPHLCRVPWSGFLLPLRHAALIVRRLVSSSESPYPLRRLAAVLSGTGQSGASGGAHRPPPPRAVRGLGCGGGA